MTTDVNPRRSGLAAALVVAVFPAGAQATTVSANVSALTIVDAAGIDDRLEVSGTLGSTGTVTSTNGRAITAGSGCTQTSPTTVECPVEENMSATLGGGADSLIERVGFISVTIDGGIGADTLTAGRTSNDTSLLGGPGNDVLNNAENATPPSGTPPTIVLRGDDGNDVIDLSFNRGGRDTARGGAGVDRVSYSRRAEGVGVTLDDVANDGSAGEADDARSDVENLVGTNAGDVLTGSAAANLLSGLGGDDALSGLGGSDVIVGRAGNDTERGGTGDDKLGSTAATTAVQNDPGVDSFFGEEGADQLFTSDGEVDSVIDCGLPPDFDNFAALDLVDPDPIECEETDRAAKDQHPTVQVRGNVVRVRGGRAAVPLHCPRAAPGRRCSGTVRVVRLGRTLARGRYRIRSGRSRTVLLEFRGRARGRAEVRTSERDTRGRPETTRTAVLLRR